MTICSCKSLIQLSTCLNGLLKISHQLLFLSIHFIKYAFDFPFNWIFNWKNLFDKRTIERCGFVCFCVCVSAFEIAVFFFLLLYAIGEYLLSHLQQSLVVGYTRLKSITANIFTTVTHSLKILPLSTYTTQTCTYIVIRIVSLHNVKTRCGLHV